MSQYFENVNRDSEIKIHENSKIENHLDLKNNQLNDNKQAIMI